MRGGLFLNSTVPQGFQEGRDVRRTLVRAPEPSPGARVTHEPWFAMVPWPGSRSANQVLHMSPPIRDASAGSDHQQRYTPPPQIKVRSFRVLTHGFEPLKWVAVCALPAFLVAGAQLCGIPPKFWGS